MGTRSFPCHYPADLHDKDFEIHGRTLAVIIVVLCLIVCFGLFAFFTRWNCRDSRLPVTTRTITGSQPGTALVISGSLDPATISSIPVLLHRTSTTGLDEAQCSICLTSFIENEKLKVLPGCHHCYHPECIDKWLGSHSNCPVCRASLRVDSSALTAEV
ncbi:hypothetical protein GIB67_014298 [Kingdonia uniflora]|uniref:RING-type domain-containing protein n=1 Tax=Kingdonia uniflora TaxID=39325 RepID=A0A7J7KVR0_9MAGN|nr:hypothetical protein GIB67_038161 [Kingdonia uniflora]KAF6170368.1 hypothetical protein GIB67_014298 [Kingdonia uniflora]